MSATSPFYRATEIESLTKYSSGISSLEEFNSVLQKSDSIECFKSVGLSEDDIEFYTDYKKGEEYMQQRHKNMNKDALETRVKKIEDLIKNSNQSTESER